MLRFQPGDEVIIKERHKSITVYRSNFIIKAIERRLIFVESNVDDERYAFDADSLFLNDDQNVSILLKEDYDKLNANGEF